MSSFVENIEARLLEIAQLIAAAGPTQRRALQRERADLELKLKKVKS